MSKIIGIDLGTSNSAAAVMMGGRPTIVPSAEGPTMSGKMFPSYVAFTKDGQMLVGTPAKRQAVTNPDGTVFAAKRLMGTDKKITIRGKEYTPQEISAYILQKIKRDSEEFLGEEVTKAVITVPAYFDDNQRTATKDAGRIAGLEVVRIINEPTAASLAYGVDKTETDKKVLVFDLGAGTLDVTIMEFGDGVFDVISTSGDTQLGGKDMDDVVVNWLASEFKTETGVDLSKNPEAMNRLREASEKAKIELSNIMETEINLPYITADDSGPKHLVKKLSRSKLEELVDPIVKKCQAPMEQAIKDAKLTPKGVDRVILVGGPTRMPIVRKFVEEYVDKKAERGVDPMECVSMGAAIQAGVIAGEVKDILLLDVTPLSLGVETLGSVFTVLIERNTTIPVTKKKIFSTAADYQPSVDVHVLQGERPMAADNTSLGRFTLTGIPPAPRGIPQIEVSFDIDANGILNVSAKDLGTGKQQSITITSSTKLSEKEIEDMIKNAQKFADDDKKRKEVVETRNQAETLVYTAEKTIADLGDKVTEDERKSIQEAVKALKEAMEKDDNEAIKEMMKKLEETITPVVSKMYQQAAQDYAQQQAQQEGGPQTGQSGEDNSQGSDDNVVDADYKVVDDKE